MLENISEVTNATIRTGQWTNADSIVLGFGLLAIVFLLGLLIWTLIKGGGRMV